VRNARSAKTRQAQLLTPARAEYTVADRQPLPAEEREANDARARVRATLDRMCARDRSLLLLRAEGFAYRDIAEALELNEASVGTMLARARDAFRQLWEETVDAS
jgi:RNA polymerase sigma factor (sigma-70 family)